MFKSIDPIKVASRTVKGRGEMTKLRKRGLLPGVIYGKGENLMVQFAPEVMRSIKKYSDVFPIDMDGTVRLVHIKEMQYNPMTEVPIHCDFFEVDENKKMMVSVPFKTEGKAAGVAVGGQMNVFFRELKINCFPKSIPEAICIDVTKMEIGHALRVKDITDIVGVDILLAPNEPLVIIEAKAGGEEVVGADAQAAPAAAK